MFLTIKAIFKKELRQIFRDKRTLGVLLFVPAFMLIMFGYALNFDVKHLSLAIYDENKSQISREFTENFLNTEYFDFKYYLSDKSEIDELMGEEKIKIAIVIPRDFSDKIISGQKAKVQIIIDGANSNTATTAIGYVNMIIQNYSTNIMQERLERRGINGDFTPIDYRPRIWYNPELKSVKFLVPGLIAFILMITAVISTALSIVREKERGTMEQITVSPIKPVELILGKTVPYAFLSLIAAVIILFFSYILFDISIKGSILWLFISMVIFIIGGLGMGLLISTIADSQQVAFMISTFATLLPTFLLSGFVFPIRNMPLPIQIITLIVPARYFLVVLRNIILKGAGVIAFWEQIVALVIFAIIMLRVSAFRMRKK
jgi:ABC-2 type transport system permease protein